MSGRVLSSLDFLGAHSWQCGLEGVLSAFPAVLLLNVKEFPPPPRLFSLGCYASAVSPAFPLCSSLTSPYDSVDNMPARRGNESPGRRGTRRFAPTRSRHLVRMPLKAEAL